MPSTDHLLALTPLPSTIITPATPSKPLAHAPLAPIAESSPARTPALHLHVHIAPSLAFLNTKLQYLEPMLPQHIRPRVRRYRIALLRALARLLPRASHRAVQSLVAAAVVVALLRGASKRLEGVVRLLYAAGVCRHTWRALSAPNATGAGRDGAAAMGALFAAVAVLDTVAGIVPGYGLARTLVLVWAARDSNALAACRRIQDILGARRDDEATPRDTDAECDAAADMACDAPRPHYEL